MTLDPAAADSLKLQGGPAVAENGCDVVVRSQDPSAAPFGHRRRSRDERRGNSAARQHDRRERGARCLCGVAASRAQLHDVGSPPSGLVSPGGYCGGPTLKNGDVTLDGVHVTSDGPPTIGANAVVTGANVAVITTLASLTTIKLAANSNSRSRLRRAEFAPASRSSRRAARRGGFAR